jgi:hypothetical protein
MKLLVLLAFAGLATAAHLGSEGLKWEPGQEYVYEYKGRLLTGLPELDSHHFSGMAIHCKVHLQSLESGRLIALQVRDVRYSRVNERLTAAEPTPGGEQESHNWRHLNLPSFSPVPFETERLLSKTSLFEISELTGLVKSVTMSSEEPEWSINFKKALISLFQTQTMQSSIERNSIEGSSVPTTPSLWTTFEESIDGECETSYELTELPESVTVSAGEHIIPKPEYCPGRSEGERSRVYELTKVRNVNNCRKRSTYQSFKPGGYTCKTGNCGGMWSRSSITRYIVCGEPNRFVIQTILNEGELVQDLMGFKSEKMLTGTRQVLKLERKFPISSRLSGPSSSIVMTSLMYKYSNGMLSSGEGSSSSSSSLRSSGGLPSIVSLSREEKSSLIPKVKSLIREIVNDDLFSLEGIPNKEISMKTLTLSGAFKLFSHPELMTVYNSLVHEFSSGEKESVFKDVLFDTVTMSGTTECIKFLKHLMEMGKMSDVHKGAFFLSLPRVVVTPTRELLEEIFELVTSSHIREKRFIYNTALLSFSTLIQKACLADNRHESYPTYVYGKFCTKESSIISEKWIPYLQGELSHCGSSDVEKKNVIVVALGLLSHEQVLPILLPIIEESETEISHMTRYLSIFSLVNVGYHYPERVLPVVSAVFSNKAESTEVRIAAFNTILKLKPDMALLQKIATLTWTETDVEVLKVVNTAFYSLSEQISMQDVKPSSSLLVRQIRLIYPLIKKTGGRFPSSASIYGNEFLNKLKVGYESINSWIGCKGSPIPAFFYSKLTYFLDEMKFSPLEYGFHLCGTDSLMQEVLDVISMKPSGEEEIKSRLTSQWREVINELSIKTRSFGKVEGSVYVNFFEDSPMFRSFKYTSSQVIREKVESMLRNPSLLREKLSGEKSFSITKMMDLSPVEIVIPSDMGLPILIEVHMPTTISVIGKIVSEPSASLSRFNINVRTLFDARYTGWVGTISPFTNEFVGTGIDEHGVVNLPADVNLSVDIREGKISMKIKPITSSRSSMSMSSSSSSGGIDFIYFSVKPYTVMQKYCDLKPVFKSPSFRMIKSRTEKYERSYPVGEYLGLDLKAEIETETPFLGYRYILEKLSTFNYNPMNKLRFFTATSTGLTASGLPSVRRHSYKIVFFPGSSRTREIDLVWKFGYATKQKDESSIKYHMLEVENSSEGSKLVPWKIVSKPAGEHSLQSGRQEKTKQLLEKLSVEEGKAFVIGFSANLIGSGPPRVWSYFLTVGAGKSGLKQKWEAKLSSPTGHESVCVSGHLEIPFYSVWKMSEIRSDTPVFNFRNTFGYGPSCSSSKIVVEGYTKTSEQLKRRVDESREKRELERLVSQGAPLIRLSELAEKVRREYTSLDEIDYKISYVNVPEYMMVVPKKIMDVLKVTWMPYWSTESPFHSSSSLRYIRDESPVTMTSIIRTKINPERQTFDVSIKNEGPSSSSSRVEEYNFRDIHLPYPLPYVFPVSYVQGPVSSVFKILTGKPIYPTCTMEGGSLTSFDNRSLEVIEMDNCYHLLSADCSKNKEYGVMVRNIESSSEGKKEIKIFLEKAIIVLKPEGSEMKVTVDGVHKELNKSEKKVIKDSRGKIIAELIKSKDGVVIFKSPKINVMFDGKKVKVEGSLLLKNKLCGLCGDNNNQKVGDMKSPRECLMSEAKLLVASYRVSSGSPSSCRPLPSTVERELRRESEICLKPVHKSTKVLRSFLSHSGECTQSRHEMSERGSRVLCFSKRPIVECSAACKPEGARVKSISFTCMERGRVAEHIARKVREGRHVPELRNLETSYVEERSVPSRCIPVNRYYFAAKATTKDNEQRTIRTMRSM